MIPSVNFEKQRDEEFFFFLKKKERNQNGKISPLKSTARINSFPLDYWTRIVYLSPIKYFYLVLVGDLPAFFQFNRVP